MDKKVFLKNKPFDDIDAKEMVDWLDLGLKTNLYSIYNPGVVNGMDVTAKSGMSLNINIGFGYDLNYNTITIKSPQTVNISQADTANPRYDVIAIKYVQQTVNNYDITNKYGYGTNYIISQNILDSYIISTFRGSPSANPTIPQIPNDYLALANIYVDKNVTNITSDNIQDARKFVTLKVGISTDNIGPNSIDDIKIGNRTINDALTANNNPNTITNLLSMLANRIKAITGESNWYTNPSTSLKSLGNINFDGSYLKLDGSNIMDNTFKLKRPSTSSSWNRGLTIYDTSGVNEEGSIGFYASGNYPISYAYISPLKDGWKSKGLRVKSNGDIVYFDGTIEHIIYNKSNLPLNSSVSSTATDQAATPSAVKTTYDYAKAHIDNSTIHITATERSNWNAKETTSGAQAKANAAETNAKNASVPRTGGSINYLNITDGSGSLNLFPGSKNHVYIQFYARNTTTRSGYIGYSDSGSDTITINNQISGGRIEFATAGGGKVYINGVEAETVNGSQAKANSVQNNLNSHTSNTTVHITSNERNSWNGKLDKSIFDTHNADNVRHITAAERSNWNAKETPNGAQAKANAAENNAKNASFPRTGGTLNGSMTVAASTAYGSRLVRNIVISTNSPSGGQNGDIWIQYE